MLIIPLWQRALILIVAAVFVIAAVPNLFYARVEGHNDAVAAIEAQGATPELEAARDAWPEAMPSGLVNLGLDLRGGAHLLAEVKVAEVYATRMDGYWPEVRDALREVREQVGTVRRQDSVPGELRVRISEPAGMEAALAAVRAVASPVVSLTGIGSNDIEVRGEGADIVVTLSEAERIATDDRTMKQSLEIIRRRVDEAGTREPTILRQGADRILIQVPGIGSAQELKDLIGQTAKLTFHPVVGSSGDKGADPGPGNLLLPSTDEVDRYYVVEQTAVVGGDDLVDAQPSFDQNGRPAVSFRFNPTGARAFGDYTAENVGEPFAIVLDNEVISAPVIQDHIPGGNGIITGTFTVEESTQLAILLRAGALPAGMDFLEERTIGPELGADSIRAGQIAAIVAAVLVVGFMAVAYGLFGWFANIALAINVVMILGIMSMIGATLTLPGIAGIVLTMGMAVDANVLIYERIREEMKRTKGPARAIDLGYEKALSAIIDANLTTLISAAILFYFGSGPVRGFAVTLTIGLFTSAFTAIYLTRLMNVSYLAWARPKAVLAWGLRLVPEKTNINFFAIQKATFGGSMALVAASFVLMMTLGLNFGIDFKGGTSIRTESPVAVDVGAYRAALEPLGLGDVTITQVYDPTFRADQNVAQVRISALEGEEAITPEVIQQVEAALGAAVGGPMTASLDGTGIDGEAIAAALDGSGMAPEVSASDTGVVLTFPAGATYETQKKVEEAAGAAGVEKDPTFAYQDLSFTSVESVGPKVSGELIWAAGLSVVLAVLGIAVYIWLRFEWQFALGGAVSLVHDIGLTIGLWAVFQLKFDLNIIAALLTILGYSINDTVVVFDRARENLIKYKTMPLRDVLNLSVNETLSRTVMTAGTTLVALIALLIFGGDVIRGFVFAMTWGIVVGTYSSVYVAKNVVLMLGVKRDWGKDTVTPAAGTQFGG